MIDNIRFNFRFKPQELVVKQKINLSLKKSEGLVGKGKGFTGKLFFKRY
jgi:hypothetical protein